MSNLTVTCLYMHRKNWGYTNLITRPLPHPFRSLVFLLCSDPYFLSTGQVISNLPVQRTDRPYWMGTNVSLCFSRKPLSISLPVQNS